MAAPRGRKSTYSREKADEICERMSNGETLRQVCRSPGMPAAPTVIGWVNDDRDGFAERYARARGDLLEHLAEELVDIADDGRNDWMERETKSGDTITVVDREHVSRSSLRIDTRKWLLSKLKPDVYGDRLKHVGDAEQPIEHNVNVRAEADAFRGRIASLAAKRSAGSGAGEPH